LAAALAAVPDPRRPFGWRPGRAPLPLVGVLQVAVAAMLCGARRLYAIAQWAGERIEDDAAALVPLGLPPGRSPSVATLHRVFAALDVAALERALGTWLGASGVDPTDAVALDGKTLRGIHGDAVPGVHLVAAYAHAAGVTLGQAASAGKGQEVAAASVAAASVPLAGRAVTGDALLTQRARCVQIVAGGGADLLPVKDNPPTLRADLEAAFSPLRADGAGGAGSAGPAPLAGGRPRRAGRRPDGGHGA